MPPLPFRVASPTAGWNRQEPGIDTACLPDIDRNLGYAWAELA
jgi:hypothetical protein